MKTVCCFGQNYLLSVDIVVPLRGKRIPLLVIQVFLQVEERVEEYRRHFTLFQIAQRYFTGIRRFNHI